jgi:hypothetical protein
MSHARRLAEALGARERDDLPVSTGEAELYCESDCSVREVTIRIKELDDPLPPQLKCPACRRQLKLHHLLTLDEVNWGPERHARISVNAQLYERAEQQRRSLPPDAPVVIPIGALINAPLPGA